MGQGAFTAPCPICLQVCVGSFGQQYVSHTVEQPSGKLDSAFWKSPASFPEGRVKLDCNMVQYLQSRRKERRHEYHHYRCHRADHLDDEK